VVVNDKFGIRLTDIVTPSERMRRLSRVERRMASNAMTALLWFVAILILNSVSLWLLKRTPWRCGLRQPAFAQR